MKKMMSAFILLLLVGCSQEQTAGSQSTSSQSPNSDTQVASKEVQQNNSAAVKSTAAAKSELEAILKDEIIHAQAAEPSVELAMKDTSDTVLKKSEQVVQSPAATPIPKAATVKDEEVLAELEKTTGAKPKLVTMAVATTNTDKAAREVATSTVSPVAKVIAPLVQEKMPPRTEPAANPLPKMVSIGDAAVGEQIAKKCTVCHTLNQDGKNKVGPNLFGVVGRERGTFPGFKYDTYLSNIGGSWNEQSLKAWVADSKGVADNAGKKTKMPAQKITAQKADDLIAYLKTLK